MNQRGLAALALLFFATGLERCGYYGSRTFMSVDLRATGHDPREVGIVYGALQGFVLLGILVGGVAALKLGPRLTAAGGALFAAIGHFALAGGAPILAGAGLIAFGAGVFRPCPVVVAADTLAWGDESAAAPGPHRFAAVAAFAVLSLAAINVGAFVAPILGGTLRHAGGSALAYGVNGATLIVAALLGSIAAWLGLRNDDSTKDATLLGPYRNVKEAPAPAPAPRSAGLALAGLGILLLLDAVFVLGSAVSQPPLGFLEEASSMWLFSLGPLVTTFVSVLVFVLLLLWVLQRWPLPPLVLHGAGLVIFALGLVPIALAGETSKALYGVGSAVTGIGEAAMYGVPLAYASTALRGRAATLLVAGWMAAGLLMNTLASAVGAFDTLRTPLLWALALLGVGGGAALLAFARRMHRSFFEQPRPPEGLPLG